MKFLKFSVSSFLIVFNSVFCLAQTPDIKYVSVQTDDSVQIEWNSLVGVDSFKIVPQDSPIDLITTAIQVLDGTATSTKVYEPLALRGSFYYVVKYWSGGSQQGESATPFRAINLSAIVDPCALTAKLTWNSNYGWSSPTYYVKDDLGAVLATTTDTTTTISLTSGTSYELYVQASGPGGLTANSYKVTFNSGGADIPSYVNLSTTVIDEENVLLTGKIDPAVNITNVKIVRSRLTGGFDTIAYLSGISNGEITYTDYDAIADKYSYKYQIVAVNDCGVDVYASNYSNSMAVDVNISNGYASVTWDRYEPLDTFDVFYRLERINSDGSVLDIVSNYDKGSYVDTLNDNTYNPANYLDSKVCYRVYATDPTPAVNGTTEMISNIYCGTIIPKLSIPNAFTPNGDGVNDIFIPYFDYKPKEYLLLIYNKWGNLLFKSTVPELGWDGTFNGSMIEEGVYTYSIKVTTHDDKFFYKEGAIAVVYP